MLVWSTARDSRQIHTSGHDSPTIPYFEYMQCALPASRGNSEVAGHPEPKIRGEKNVYFINRMSKCDNNSNIINGRGRFQCLITNATCATSDDNSHLLAKLYFSAIKKSLHLRLFIGSL